MSTPIYSKEEAIEFVAPNGMNLKYINTMLRDDLDVVISAIMEDGRAIQYASDRLRRDKSLIILAINQRGDSFLHIDAELKKQKDVVLLAVTRNGRALEYTSNELKNDREIVLAAVKQNGVSFEHAGASLKQDREIVLSAMVQNCSTYWLLCKTFQEDPAILFLWKNRTPILDVHKNLIIQALLTKPDYFLNPEPYIKTLTEGIEHPYFILAQYALSRDITIEPALYPGI